METQLNSSVIRYLSEAEWEKLCDTPFNPGDCDEGDFLAEYCETHRRIRTLVERYTAVNVKQDPEDAITMNEDYGDSRWIAVEVRAPELLQAEFIRSIQHELGRISQAYLVALEPDFTEPPLDGIWDVFVTRESVLAFAKTEAAAAYLNNA